MAGHDSKIEVLQAVPLFSSCTKKELERVAKATDEVSMAAGRTFVHQGEVGREAFIVVEGEVTIERSGQAIATLGPGEVVGELSLLDHGPRSASATCATDCKLLVVDQRRFTAVIDDVHSIAHKLMATLAARIREMDRNSTV